VWIFKGPIYFGCGLFCLATNQIAQTGLSSLPPVIYYSEQLFSQAQEYPEVECCSKRVALETAITASGQLHDWISNQLAIISR
ncbi:hypothetical protein, partial [Aeromonas caviae]|uniref:hypothetical protein n=1 Tax=Aeromonas caviae TaxID=648 RepID=UPI001C1FA9AC